MNALNSRRTYEWQITDWWTNIQDYTPEWPDAWDRGTLQQLHKAIQPYLHGAEYAWRVRDPKTSEIIPRDTIRDYWMDRELQEARLG